MNGCSKPGFCFVLPWSFAIPGGVNEVLKNLIREFATHSDIGYTPMAMELGWASADRHNSLLEIPEIIARVGLPYNPNSPLRALAAFLLHLPADLAQLSRIARSKNVA